MKFLLALCALLFAVPATAATYRYEFDVVSSTIAFDRLIDNSSQYPKNYPANDPDHQGMAKLHHRLGGWIGLAGRSVLEIENHEGGGAYVECISGFVCPFAPYYAMGEGTSSTFGLAFGAGDEWRFRPNRTTGDYELAFFDDGVFVANFEHEGILFSGWSPYASFQLDNVVITEVTQADPDPAPSTVPLPASAYLLSIGLFGLTIATRRRRRG
ncbi:VPLPA-CTERM sorting domain-containing protein [Phaeobacter sp. 22II1-1F12B]|uniref:VPLPA-CTERM sorting domain-containing protein n=1 Tax=Phaeobacter sp. 22II1-1F12B TaxID=1317111 RepID=UPI000B526715|nr:VPLPA-CTERM sorting domain-containing protein [Phaeobacter sp. 22II1-1F12B]OWU80417.1 hypothetical protein ATO1_08680 [Phaeobacter sp. 22II1-1F12B]